MSLTESHRPVRALDVMKMADRLASSAQQWMAARIYSGPDSPHAERHQRAYNRRQTALRRLACTLEHQTGGVR
jgi:hypothetical protein